jgi:hypothetical protein
MRFVDIRFSQRNAIPGGSISGVVIVETDETFNCNRIVLKVKGKERTEMGSGDSSISDEYIHASGEMFVSDAVTIRPGKTEFPFAFVLDKNIPPTFSGYYGWIEYSVEAVVEVDWRFDPKMTRRFRVLPIHPEYIPEVDGYNPKSMKTNVLHVELPSDILRMREGIPVNFMVEEHSRVTGVRFEIRRRESAKCSHSTGNNDETIERKFVPLQPHDFGKWREFVLGTEWRRVPFRSKLLKTEYFLKVVLEMRWEIDPFVTYKLRISGKRPEEEEEDIFDDLAIDLGFR